MAQAENVRKVKVVLIGPGAVGKTCSMKSFLYEKFHDKSLPTIGVDFASKTVVKNDWTIQLMLWDFAGQGAFGIIRKPFYGGTNAVVLMLDLTRAATLQGAKEYIDKELVPCIGNVDLLCMAVVGNKMDLEDDIKISNDDLAELAEYAKQKLKVRGVFWMKSSSKQIETNRKMYESLVQCIIKGMEPTSTS